jgi:hypothetical protein
MRTTGRRVAGIGGADIAVITTDGASCASPGLTGVVLGAGVAIITRSAVRTANVAGNRRMFALAVAGVAGVSGTGIIIVAIGRRHDQLAFSIRQIASSKSFARVSAVSALLWSHDIVHATGLRVAAVDGAILAIITTDGASRASPGLTGVVFGAGVAIITRSAVRTANVAGNRRMFALAVAGVAGVSGTGIIIVAIGRRHDQLAFSIRQIASSKSFARVSAVSALLWSHDIMNAAARLGVAAVDSAIFAVVAIGRRHDLLAFSIRQIACDESFTRISGVSALLCGHNIVHTACLGITAIDGAILAVVTIDGASRTNPCLTGVILGTGVAIITRSAIHTADISPRKVIIKK